VADERIVAAWARARAGVGLPPRAGFPFAIRSDVPFGAGLGSSAALGVALVRAAAREAGVALPLDGIAALATGIEDLFHGRSSGLDPAVVAHEAPVLWRSGKGCDVLAWAPVDRDLVVAIAPGSRRTSDAVARVSAFAARFPRRFYRMTDEAATITASAAAALAAGRSPEGESLARNHDLLAELGLSSPAIEEVLAAMIGAGATGGKLSGAGLSGAVIALAPARFGARIAEAARSAGALDAFVAGLAAPVAATGTSPTPGRP
jgi:mevalonate kinase